MRCEIERYGATVARIFQKIRVRFFGTLIAAFALVIALVGGGMFLAGREVLNDIEENLSDHRLSPAMQELWVARLTHYYAQQDSWEDVDAMIAGYPIGPGWEPWDEEWKVGYVIATKDGTIVASSDGERLGQTLNGWESEWSAPIVVHGQQVGLLHMSVADIIGFDPSNVVKGAVRGFLLLGLIIGGLSLVVGTLLSRRISQPLEELTTATRAVATGDLSVRVPVQHRGEIRELAVAFNAMAEEIACADELRRNLTADVAHELRTPLSVVRGKLEGVLDGIYPATPDHLEPILEETELLIHLVEDLRLLALAEAGQLTLEKQSMDVGDLLRDARVNFTPQASDRGVTLALDLPAEPPQAVADRRRVGQVVGNLVTNALRHTPSGGCVTLSTAVSEGMLHVTVSDTGTGISPEDLPHIFERFWRGEKSRARATGGTGLGLAIARHLVHLNGGTISVESTPGQGSTFRFTLPLA